MARVGILLLLVAVLMDRWRIVAQIAFTRANFPDLDLQTRAPWDGWEVDLALIAICIFLWRLSPSQTFASLMITSAIAGALCVLFFSKGTDGLAAVFLYNNIEGKMSFLSRQLPRGMINAAFFLGPLLLGLSCIGRIIQQIR